MEELLAGAPVFFLVLVAVISLAFVALPTWFARRVLRDRFRRRTWTRTTATLLGTQVRTYGSGERRRTALVGRWSYRVGGGVEHTGQGDLSGVWIPRPGEAQEIEVLVDPVDPSRSMALSTERSVVVLLVVSLVMAVFFLIGATLLLGALSVLLGLA